MAITALGLAHARSLSAGDPRRSIALMTAAFGLGQMIGPSFAGFAYEASGSFTLPTLVASAVLVAAFALTLVWRRARESGVEGKGGSGRVDIGWRRLLNKK